MTPSRASSVLAAIVATACGAAQQTAPQPELNPSRQPPPVEPAPPQPEPAETEPEQTSAPPLERAEAAWAQREDMAALQQAIAAWSEHLTTHPADPAVLTKLARALNFLADAASRAPGSETVRLAALEKGLAASERAMLAYSEAFAAAVHAGDPVERSVALLPPEGQQAMYWYAVHLCDIAAAKGFTSTLLYKDRILGVLQRVLDVDESFLSGAPHRALGIFYATAPASAGGDVEKARQHFERAVALAPQDLASKVAFAELYATRTEDEALFTRLLKEVQAADPGVMPEWLPEQRAQQRRAAELLERAKELF